MLDARGFELLWRTCAFADFLEAKGAITNPLIHKQLRAIYTQNILASREWFLARNTFWQTEKTVKLFSEIHNMLL